MFCCGGSCEARLKRSALAETEIQYDTFALEFLCHPQAAYRTFDVVIFVLSKVTQVKSEGARVFWPSKTQHVAFCRTTALVKLFLVCPLSLQRAFINKKPELEHCMLLLRVTLGESPQFTS